MSAGWREFCGAAFAAVMLFSVQGLTAILTLVI